MKNKELLKFEILNENNALGIKNWGVHNNPLFFDYNVNIKNKREARAFSRRKNSSPFNKYYAIIYDRQIQGYLGLKNINPIFKSSVLGFVINPAYIDQGLGTLALGEFLKKYFYQDKMKLMSLEVANYNPRAQRVYEKMGFKKKKTYEAIYPNGDIDWSSPYLANMENMFRKKMGRWYYRVINMELRKEDFDEVFYRKT